jgi:hypothetical protein
MARYLDYRNARDLADEIETAVARIRLRFREAADPKALEHEIALALGRAACRYGFDILPPMASTAIDRLECAVAELHGKIERHRDAITPPPLPPAPDSIEHALRVEAAIREGTPAIDVESIDDARELGPVNGKRNGR